MTLGNRCRGLVMRSMKGSRNDLKARAGAWLCLATVAMLGAPALARDLPSPTGQVVLTVTGDIGTENAPGAALFDIAMLQQMPQSVVQTSTPWTSGEPVFEGVALADLLDVLGVESGQLEMHALNDYRVTVPLEDAFEKGAVVAHSRDGARLPVRAKGPLWLIYPFDQLPRTDQERYHHRAIWHLTRITVVGK